MDARRVALWVLGTPSVIALLCVVARVVTARRRRRNRITCTPTPQNEALRAACPSWHVHDATPWLPGPHASTFWAVALRPNLGLRYRRIMLHAADGGVLAVDWHTLPRRGQPVLLLLHGLTGGSQEAYIQHMIRAAWTRLGVACVVMNARGCSTSTLHTARCFSAAWTEDVRACVAYVRSVVGDEVPLFAVGYSLGAGVLAKFVAEEAEQCRLTAAVACCASYDMRKSTHLLESGVSMWTYNRVLAAALRRFVSRHYHHFTHSDLQLDWARIAEARTVRQFDTATIVPMFGYENVWDYYHDASSGRLLHQVRVPLLMLNAEDDPICDTAGVPLDVVRSNENLVSVITKEGGHVSWCQGWFPGTASWDNDAVCEFIAALCAQRGFITAPPTADELLIANALYGVPTDALPISPHVIRSSGGTPTSQPAGAAGGSAGVRLRSAAPHPTQVLVDADADAEAVETEDGAGVVAHAVSHAKSAVLDSAASLL